MRNTEQMVSVPRKWVENYADLLEERCAYEASERVQALLAQPAAQHQGEPVKTPARDESLGTAERDEYANGYRHGWNAYNDEIAKLGPLYTHPDAGEVERLRRLAADLAGGEVADLEETRQANAQLTGEIQTSEQEVERLRGIIRMHEKTVLEQSNHLAYMRAHLAEAHALLRDLVSMDIPRTAAAIERAKQILSASAEPKPICETCQGTWSKEQCQGCFK